MKDLIRSLNITKSDDLIDIEEKLLDIPDFSSDYYLVKKLNSNSYVEAALEIYEYLHI